jgi:transcriptional regulator with XRE-family HTH domain
VTVEDLMNVSFRPLLRVARLARELGNRGFRHAYMARQIKAFLAQQIRALRGDLSQNDFGVLIGKPQSVVSRLEKQADRHISIQTLIDIAERLDIAVVIRFVDFLTFLRSTHDYSDAALKPKPFTQEAIDEVIRDEKQTTVSDALRSLSVSMQTTDPSVKDASPPCADYAIGTRLERPANDTGVLSAVPMLRESHRISRLIA